jgi:plastocyanin
MKKSLKRVFPVLFLLAISPLVKAQTSHAVDVTNNIYTPADIVIQQGDTIIWTNSQGFHNVNGTQATYPDNPESFGNSTGRNWVFSHVFTEPGFYDYQCDPHVGLGMVGTVTVESAAMDTLFINFSGMNPHVGQTLWILVNDEDSGDEVARFSTTVAESFTLEITGIMSGSAYEIDFFVDFNANGFYDAPPADHAWRLEIAEASGDEALEFTHNTDFTDIEWKHELKVRFSGMTPHLGQAFTLFVRDAASGETLDTLMIDAIEDESFDLRSYVIEVMGSYMIDFYADHNGNGSYDAPPADHAWRLETGQIMGDTDLEFSHNTNFTDIEAPLVPTLTVNISGMTPHVGQQGWILLIDEDTGEEVERGGGVVEESFPMVFEDIVPGHSYTLDIWVDHNGNGYYDAPPADHAWRLEIPEVSDNEMVDFVHNTDFTDIEWEHRAILNLSGMTPHVGQEIYFALIESASGEIVDRISETVMEAFTVELGELQMGSAYHLDFFSDHNGNGYYDAPPADHAWRLEIPEAMGDDTLDFVHNTEFTDILWKHRLRVRFSGMNPHAGQMLTLYVRDLESGEYLDTVMVEEIEESFDVKSYSLVPGESYMIDFYADHNGNGSYDAPPVDHAWRIETGEAMGDLDVDFSHNTDFTDIFEVTGISENERSGDLTLYPNPVRDVLHIRSDHKLESIRIFSVSGMEVLSVQNLGVQETSVSMKELQAGVYVVNVINVKGDKQVVRLLKQ